MRKLIVLVGSLGLILALGTPAEAARKFRVKASISSSSIMIGQSVTITGSVSPKASGRKVILYKKQSGSNWKREAATRVRSDGTFRFTDKPKSRKSRLYRVTKPKAGKYRAGQSKAMRLTVRKVSKTTPKVSVSSVSSRTIEAGQSVTVSGQVTRTMAGRYAQLQVGPGGAWGRVGAARIGSDGSYSVTAAITQAGAAVPLRVVVPASKYNHPVAADAGSVKVYGWQYLYDMDEVEGYWYASDFTISGQSYAKSISQYNGGSAQANLGRACTRFVATVGLSDNADAAAEAATQTYADNVSKYSRTGIKLGQAFPIDINVTGALRLKLDSQDTGPGDGYLVWGDARILCAF